MRRCFFSHGLSLVFLVVSFLAPFGMELNAAAPVPPSPVPSAKDWTFFVFMAGDNDLESCTEKDINELETIGSTDRVNVVVQVDRNGKYSQESDWKWSGAKRFLVQQDDQPDKVTSPVLQDLGHLLLHFFRSDVFTIYRDR